MQQPVYPCLSLMSDTQLGVLRYLRCPSPVSSAGLATVWAPGRQNLLPSASCIASGCARSDEADLHLLDKGSTYPKHNLLNERRNRWVAMARGQLLALRSKEGRVQAPRWRLIVSTTPVTPKETPLIAVQEWIETGSSFSTNVEKR